MKKRNDNGLSITFEKKVGNSQIRGLPFISMKEDVLEKDYNLSLVFVDDKESQELNREWRNKNYPANVLSFPLGEAAGEIFINVDAVKRESGNFNMSNSDFIAYLFVHGLLHLKGLGHGSKMKREEQRILKRHKLTPPE